MKNPRNLIIFAVLGGIVGFIFGLSIALISGNTRGAEGDIRIVLDRQVKGWNAGDIEGFMQGYLKSDQLRFASGGDITTGWDETLNRYQKRYSDRAKMGTLKFDIKDVDVLDHDDGLVFGQWTLFRDGDKPTGLFTLHMKKGADGWKVVSDHTSSAD
jgi:ketosteroid isomerase-like protein